MEDLEPQRITKGGVCWFDLAISRGPRGLEVFAKTDSRIEDFIKTLGSGKKDTVEVYGRSWYGLGPTDLEIHTIDRNIPNDRYTLEAVAEGWKSNRDDRTNLSFLRIVGIGSPEGIRFGVAGPFSRSFVKTVMADVIAETRNLIRDYIVPVHINLRISSTEL